MSLSAVLCSPWLTFTVYLLVPSSIPFSFLTSLLYITLTLFFYFSRASVVLNSYLCRTPRCSVFFPSISSTAHTSTLTSLTFSLFYIPGVVIRPGAAGATAATNAGTVEGDTGIFNGYCALLQFISAQIIKIWNKRLLFGGNSNSMSQNESVKN